MEPIYKPDNLISEKFRYKRFNCKKTAYFFLIIIAHII